MKVYEHWLDLAVHFGKVSTCEFLTLIHFSSSPFLYMIFCYGGLLNPMNFESEENNMLIFFLPSDEKTKQNKSPFKEQQEMFVAEKLEKGSFLCPRRTTPCSHCPSRLSGEAPIWGGMRHPWVGQLKRLEGWQMRFSKGELVTNTHSSNCPQLQMPNTSYA